MQNQNRKEKMNREPQKAANNKNFKFNIEEETNTFLEKNREKQKSQKLKKTYFVTRTMAEDFTRDDVLCTTLKEAALFAVFVVAITLCTFGRRTSSMFYLVQGLKREFVLKEFDTSRGPGIKFEEISTISEFWQYSTTLLLDGLYGDDENDDSESEETPLVLMENKLLGVPRIRQVRVGNKSCDIHEMFQDMFKNCYNEYTTYSEDKEPFGLGKGTAWTYSPPDKTESIDHDGNLATYSGGGYYLDLSKNKAKTRKMLENLRDNLWITSATRAIFIDFALYNANINLFCLCKLVLEQPPVGGIKPQHRFRAAQLLFFVDSWDYITFVAEIASYIIMCYYILEELREVIYFKHRYLQQYWSYIDVVTIAMAAGTLKTSLTVFPIAEGYMKRIENHPNKYGNLEYLKSVARDHNNYSAALLFFAYIKLFKYLNFNKIMGQLNNTLKRCALDILGFSIMFFIVFFAYSQLGHVVFGHVVDDFRSFGVAMFTLLRTILGDFNFEDISRANRIMAPLYFLTYIFLVFFVLLNMFLAIINDTYADVKTEIAVVPDEMQMTDFVKGGIRKMLEKCHLKRRKEADTQSAEIKDIDQQIREALRECGFNDLEIEMFFARYNIDPLAEMGGHDMKEILTDIESRNSNIAREHVSEREANVYLRQFTEQQRRLEQLEDAIGMLVGRVNVLLRRLEQFESVRKLHAKG